MPSKIEWCDETVNPLVGCWPAGAGCDNCYAARIASRGMCDSHRAVADKEGWNGQLVVQPKQIEKLKSFVKSSTPKRIFVGSMTDLGYAFDIGTPGLHDTWQAMKVAGEAGHTIIVLTKRPDHLGSWIRQEMAQDDLGAPPSWLWVLVSVWDQESSDRLVPELLDVPAGLHGVSCEPLLGPIDLLFSAFSGSESLSAMGGIKWVIAGCESGPGRRQSKVDWFRVISQHCAIADIPFFLKQAEIGGRLVKMPKLEGRQRSEIPRS